MQKKYLLLFAGFLFALNIFCWQEVFVLAEPRYLKVDFLDVGQGDSVFIETPENHQILIDGGPDSSVLERISKLMPFWDKSIDLVILTHPEKDHMQGLLNVLKKYRVDYILWSGVEKISLDYDEWVKDLIYQKELGAKIISIKAGDNIKIGEASINILFPFDDFTGQKLKDSVNKTCVVFDLTFGANSFLFTGDISTKEEKEIVNIYGTEIRADVLKIAHHGSKYSSCDEFLQNVTPKFAVIEVGENSYGHPTPEVLQKLEKFGIQTLRTDINGNVEFLSDGENIELIKN